MFFNTLEFLPNDPILHLSTLFREETRSNKVNLGVGIYQDNLGQPVVFDSVKKAEAILLEQNLNKNYPPIDGESQFVSKAPAILFNSLESRLSGHPVYVAQTLGGTGALRLGAELLNRNGRSLIFLPKPSWPNHRAIFSAAHLIIGDYPYYDPKTQNLDFSNMCAKISQMPPGSIILLQVCCHNPSGIDPNEEQWSELATLIQKQKLIPFFDLAYQGFGRGFQEDAFPVHYFYELGLEMLIAYSFSKNLGLYGERLGLLGIVSSDESCIPAIASQIKRVIREMYSMPPLHSARIANVIFSSSELMNNWQSQLTSMRLRLCSIKKVFKRALGEKIAKLEYEKIEHNGLFLYCGLAKPQVVLLREKYAIFMPEDGRINTAGLNDGNINYVIASLVEALNS